MGFFWDWSWKKSSGRGRCLQFEVQNKQTFIFRCIIGTGCLFFHYHIGQGIDSILSFQQSHPQKSFYLIKSYPLHTEIFINATLISAVEQECIHIAEQLPKVCCNMFITSCKPRCCIIAKPQWNILDMFYDLLICAVNPSVCLQWGGSGWVGWEDGRREDHFV